MDDQEVFFHLELSKAVEEADGKRYMYGVASTEGVDLQGDILESSGLKKSADFFLKNGYIDYDHRSVDKKDDKGELVKGDLAAIIGKPISMVWDGENRALFKGELYKGIKYADDVWKLLNNKHKLGLSVGGSVLDKVTQYDTTLGKNVNRLKKVFVQHIAVTPKPANPETETQLKPYAEFMKSLSPESSHITDDIFEGLFAAEEERLSNLQKDMSATGNAPQEGSGGVKFGGNVTVPESLEGAKKKNKKVVLNKNISLEFSDDSDTIYINTEHAEETIVDKELCKSEDVDKEQIVGTYLDLLKALSSGDKKALNIDEYLLSKGLNRSSRRIIQRHMTDKLEKAFSDDNLAKSILLGEPYEKDGVVYTSQESPDNIPVNETDIPSAKQFILTDSEIEDKAYEEAKECDMRTLEWLKDDLVRQDYDTKTDAELLVKYNSVRSAYGFEPLEEKEFSRILRCNAIRTIREYDEVIMHQIGRVITEAFKKIVLGNHIDPMKNHQVRHID